MSALVLSSGNKVQYLCVKIYQKINGQPQRDSCMTMTADSIINIALINFQLIIRLQTDCFGITVAYC